MKLDFDKRARLLKRAEFQRVQHLGKRFRGDAIRFSYLATDAPTSKLGVTVTKKFGKAHDRNLFKRLSREAFRHIRAHLPKNVSMTVFPNTELKDLSFKKIVEDFHKFALHISL